MIIFNVFNMLKQIKKMEGVHDSNMIIYQKLKEKINFSTKYIEKELGSIQKYIIYQNIYPHSLVMDGRMDNGSCISMSFTIYIYIYIYISSLLFSSSNTLAEIKVNIATKTLKTAK